MELQKAIMIPMRLTTIPLKRNFNSNYVLPWENKNIFPLPIGPKLFSNKSLFLLNIPYFSSLYVL